MVENDTTISKEVTIGGIIYEVKGTVDFIITPKGPVVPPVPDPNPPKPDVPKPDSFGTIKDGAQWSKNPGPAATWKLVAMKDNPKLFKFVDAAGLNIIADLVSEAQAKALQEYFDANVFPPKEEGGTVPPPTTTEPEEPGTGTGGGSTTTGEGPYPAKPGSKVLESSQRGPTTRHYASGKPDDETIEKNVKDIPYRNYQFLVETTIKEMEHDDTISLKFGGQHTTGKGWFDTGIGIYDGQTCLGTEPEHPETHLCIVKGPKIGDIRNKKIKIAGVFFEKEDHIEFWTDTGSGGWKKQIEGEHVGDLKPDHGKNHECQQRIDGFKKGSIPDLHVAVVQEIMPKV